MTDHRKFIDGSWYENQYRTPSARYHQIYTAPIPEWAALANYFHVRFVEAFLSTVPKETKVLDLGSGVGRQLDVWEALGYECMGVEISASAIKHSGRKNVLQRSAADLSCFKDGEFGLVFSNAFLEHISTEISTDVFRESMRVARMGAHWVPMDAGDDPSHIHIQSREAWIEEALVALGPGFAVGFIENQVDATQPLLVIARKDQMPWPLVCVDTFSLQENP